MNEEIKMLHERCDALERVIRGMVNTQSELIETIKILSSATVKNSNTLLEITNAFTNETDV